MSHETMKCETTKNQPFPYGKIIDGSLALSVRNEILIKSGIDFVCFNYEISAVEKVSNIIAKPDIFYIIPSVSVNIGDVIKRKSRYLQIISVSNDKTKKYRAVDLSGGWCEQEVFKETIIKGTDLVGFKKVVSISNLNSLNKVNQVVLATLLSNEENLSDNDIMILLTMNNAANEKIQYKPDIISLFCNKNNSDEDEMYQKLMVAITASNNMNNKNPIFDNNILMFMMMNKGENAALKKLMLLQTIG